MAPCDKQIAKMLRVVDWQPVAKGTKRGGYRGRAVDRLC